MPALSNVQLLQIPAVICQLANSKQRLFLAKAVMMEMQSTPPLELNGALESAARHHWKIFVLSTFGKSQ
jgi:hypothetical protein